MKGGSPAAVAVAISAFVSFVCAVPATLNTDPRLLVGRATIDRSFCTREEWSYLLLALKNCQTRAFAAAEAAVKNPDKLQEYFKPGPTYFYHTMRIVNEVFVRIGNECGQYGDKAFLHCLQDDNERNHDNSLKCRPNQNTASVIGATGDITICPLFFNVLPSSLTCHYPDQSIILIHELTHVSAIRGTQDTFNVNGRQVGGYGYDAVRTLAADLNLWHADTFAYFAQAIYVESRGIPC